MNIFKYILIGLTFDFGQALSGNPSEQFTISIVLNAESELLTTFLSSNIVPVACAGAVRNELLIASDENRTIIQTSDLELQLMQRFLFALVTQMDSDVYMAYMGFEDGTFLGYSNQGAIVDTGLYGALHASSFGVNSKNATTYDFNAPDRLCSTLNKTSFCGSVWTSRAPIGEPETWFTSLYDDYDVRTREWYIAGKEKSSGITKVYPFFSAGQGLTGYLDLRDANDVFVGVAAWDLRLAEFSRRAKSYIRQVDPLDELKLSVAVLDGILPNSTNRTILSPPPDPPLTLLALSGSPKAARGGNLKGTNRVAAVNATDDFVKHAARVLEQNGWQTNKVFIADHRFVYIIEMAVENILELSSAEPWWLMVSYEIQCPIGFYESESDEGCVLCEEPRTTSGRFSSFCDWCTSGMYLDERDNSCHDCPSNTDCDKPGVTLETLPLEEGYMRMHTLSDDVRYCVGSYSESDPGDTEICPGGPDAKNVPCDPDSNRVGPRCALCDHNYYMRSDECFRCRTTSLKSPSVMIPLIVYSLVVLLLLYWLVRSAAAHAHNLKRGNKYARLQAKIRTKWRILFVAVQILASMPDIVDAPYPKTFRSVVDFVGGIFTLDISLVIPFACLKFGQNEGRGASYYQRIVAFSLLPFFLMSLIILYVYWRQYRWNRANSNSQAPALTTKEDNDFENPKTSTEIRPNYRQAAMSVSILICFCLYPSISSSILSIFRKCEKWDAADGSGSRLYLIGDYRVKCSGSAYLSFRIYCAFFIAIWVVGVPLTYLTELYRHLEYVDPLVDGVKARMANPGGFDAVSKAMDIRSQNPIIGHLGVLFGPYEPQYWYWEVRLNYFLFINSLLLGC
uniref:Tyrosine-protein kinase ephrin type A/B receptor-like domain-containing protein n=1 Tax=Aureoumbra lagunensis TaxID=44058 RepID=A0A7S3JY46_9STRA|mmetsp:Transcript_13791/g.20610  ORF Transcript_13791/g.20610 Transcript_13791/m.20610 type:complete len:849 (-) Transcript_13791:1010-3556(-)